jgi:hypothetical protein
VSQGLLGKDKIGIVITRGEVIMDKHGNLLEEKSINSPWLVDISPIVATKEMVERLEQV